MNAKILACGLGFYRSLVTDLFVILFGFVFNLSHCIKTPSDADD